MLRDLQNEHLLDVIRYPSVDRLIEKLDSEIIARPGARCRARGAERSRARVREQLMG
jgi:hypothetical protein